MPPEVWSLQQGQHSPTLPPLRAPLSGISVLLAVSPAPDNTAMTASLVTCGAGSEWYTPVAQSRSADGVPSYRGALGHMFN